MLKELVDLTEKARREAKVERQTTSIDVDGVTKASGADIRRDM